MLRQPDHRDDAADGSGRRRVVFVTPGFSASDDDWCIPILRDLAEGMAARNDVSIVALRYPETSQCYQVAGINVVSLGGEDRTGLSKIVLLGQAIVTVIREARRGSTDVIHAFWAHEPGAVASIAGRLTGVPVVVTLMGGELAALPEISYGGLLAPGNRMLARFSLGQANRIVALCQAVHRAAEDLVDPLRLCRLDLGVRTDRFRPGRGPLFSPPTNQIRFLAVGSLVPVKGHEVILRAFARCHAELHRTSLDLVGEGPLRGALERQVRELGLGSAVRFVGAVDHSKLVDWYHRADVLVLGSWWEGGSPQVVHEALASGIPVVGTAVGILPELTGSVRCVPVGEAETLGREMIRVAASVETRARMAAAATAAVRPIDKCIADHELLYDSIQPANPHTDTERTHG